MNYYEVLVRSSHYHGNAPLTYSSNKKMSQGQIVRVPMRHETVGGIILKEVVKPKLKIREITEVYALPPLPEQTLKLLLWLQAYYPAPLGLITQQFLPLKPYTDSTVSDHKAYTPAKLPPLTPEQKMAVDTMNKPDTYLLHGRTGSGKTRIYQELALLEMSKGRSVLVLTPEISLTSQLELEFKKVFGDSVVVIHSTLTPKQRAERWSRLLTSSEPLIVIGPRSIIFSPMANIGLVVIDEEHEPAYKQEQAPYYVTSRVAAKLRDLHDAKLILGSATPLVSDYYLASSRQKPIIRLTSLAAKQQTKMETVVVDAHDRSLYPRSQFLSEPLTTSVEQALARGEQALLYLNRRGTARAIICADCDWQARCPRCDLPLTYHGDTHILRCHVCGYSTGAPVVCPKCHNPSVKYLSIGTKAVVEEVERLFPHAKVRRFDSDSAKSERLEQHYEAIKGGEADIIVGTQLLAKGLDLPKLSVVGILLADTSLQLPDFTVNERTYQLLSQIIGRVGRGHLDGKAVIQTYQPGAPVITAALSDDWETFYAREISERRTFLFPPFIHLLKLVVSRASPAAAEKAAVDLAAKLPAEVKIEGPAPAFHEKHGRRYRWQLVVKATERSKLLEIVSTLPSSVGWDIDPIDLI